MTTEPVLPDDSAQGRACRLNTATSLFVATVALLLGCAVMILSGSISFALLTSAVLFVAGLLALVVFNVLTDGRLSQNTIQRSQTIESMTDKNLGEQGVWWVQKEPSNPIFEQGGRVFCVTRIRYVGLVAEVSDHFARHGRGVDISNHLDTAITSITDQPHGWDMLIVDLDDCEAEGELSAVVDELISLRIEVPHVVVVLCSFSFGRDDLGTDRLSIADACIKKPCPASRLLKGIPFAHENNRTWRLRTEAMESEKPIQSHV